MNSREQRLSCIIGLVLTMAVTAFISWDGLHHWHEVRFLYLTCNFSFQEILLGVFNPQQVGHSIDEASSAGFYCAKVLHLGVLKILFLLVPPAKGGLTLAVTLSMLWMALSALFFYQVLQNLLKNQLSASLGVLCFLLTPVVPYLSGKLLSETTALPLVTLSCLLFLKGSQTHFRNRFRYLLGAGVFLALTALARVDMVIPLVALAGALTFTSETRRLRQDLLLCSVSVLLISAPLYLTVLFLLGVHPDNLLAYFEGFVTGGIKSTAMSALGIATFGGFVYLFGVASFIGRKNRTVQLFALWFLLAVLPHLLVTVNYMVEPRYLTSALLPLAGLGSLGLTPLIESLTNRRLSHLLLAGVLLFTISANVFLVKLMPYELDRSALLRTVDSILGSDNSACLLVPWSYSDFHFLRIMRPEARIFNVNTPTSVDGTSLLSAAWQSRLKRFYGDRYLSNPDELNRILRHGRVYYLGWGKYPPLENAKEMARSVGLDGMSRLLDKVSGMDHLAQSWIWHSKHYHFEPKGQSGQYRYYLLTTTGGPARG